MAESSVVPSLPGLAIATVEWLPSGAESGLVRVRGRWVDESARQPDLPVLALRAGDAEHRFDSLPDSRFSREPDSWRGTYLVPAELVATDPEALWLEWPTGARAGLGGLTRGVEPPPVPAAPERPEEPDEPGGQVIDRAVLAERRARRAEAAEQAQAKVAAEALQAVEVLELRSAELERRLEEAIAERDALGEGDEGRREALSAALASAAALRSRSREWQLRMRTTEVARAGDAVRLAVLEAEHARGTEPIRAELAERGRELEAARAELEAVRRQADARAAQFHERAEAARNEAAARAAQFAAAAEAASSARAELDGRFAEARAAWDLRREELEAALAGVRSELDAAREQAAVEARAEGEELRGRIGSLEAALAVAEGRIQTTEAALAAAETRLRVETVARATLEDELNRARAEREAAEQALAEAGRAGTTLQERIAELERRAATAPELERVAREHDTVREPAEAGQVVADLDAAAEALRSRTAPPDHAWSPPAPPTLDDEDEPPAPDAEPAVEWGGPGEAPERTPCEPGVQPRRPATEPSEPLPWIPPGFEHDQAAEGGEPPAPDAEPAVESAPPVERDEPPAPDAPDVESAAPAEPSPPEGSQPPELPAPPAEPSAALPEAPPQAPLTPLLSPRKWSPPPPVERTGGPLIVSAPGPPARGLAIGTHRREYPLLRGALVKLAHDDPAAAAGLLVALLPAQGAVLEGPLSYDLTIREAGSFSVAIAGGRATIDQIDFPRPRGIADFHLSADTVVLSELLAGVEHRIGRFFGPARVRGRKRRLRELRQLAQATTAPADLARAGARLDPGVVYRLLSYAIHPTWTRGHDFTIAQAIAGAPPETWYLTAADGAGVSVSSTPPAKEPDATVTMSRDTFDRLLRHEPLAPGQRPLVRGDQQAVAAMHGWTQRVQGV